MPCTVPAATVRSTARLACTAPKRLSMARIATAGATGAMARRAALQVLQRDRADAAERAQPGRRRALQAACPRDADTPRSVQADAGRLGAAGLGPPGGERRQPLRGGSTLICRHE